MTNLGDPLKPFKLSAGTASLVFMAILTGCGTTNTIFYPTERATKAADNVIDEIMLRSVMPSNPPLVVPTPPARSDAGK